jgi:hypothetical protein
VNPATRPADDIAAMHQANQLIITHLARLDSNGGDPSSCAVRARTNSITTNDDDHNVNLSRNELNYPRTKLTYASSMVSSAVIILFSQFFHAIDLLLLLLFLHTSRLD